MTKLTLLALTTVALILPLASQSSRAEDDFPGIRELMGESLFERAGLDSLNDAELEVLNQWLVNYTAGDAELIKTTSKEVREAEKTLEIRATINQPFEGWFGDTLFYLDNGQVWRQRTSGKYRHHSDDTRVVIKEGLFGFDRMEMLSNGRTVGVKRVR
ncbi:MAG: hypothetical protein AAGI24_04910 [Pseudomonadota bacterium]